MHRILTASLALAALTMATVPARALDLSAMTAAERAAFGTAVREYLMQNPEVLVEAINELESRQQAAAAQNDTALVATYAKELFEDPNAWVGGNPEGDVTIVEFMDYKCGYCKKAYSEVEALLREDGNIRFVVKEFPILGPQSELAARFALAVRAIGGDAPYAQVHDDLMQFRGDITPDSLKRLAQTRDLDADAVLARMDSPEITAVIAANYDLAQRMAITGTPAFIIGEDMLRGYAPLPQMQKIVADQRG